MQYNTYPLFLPATLIKLISNSDQEIVGLLKGTNLSVEDLGNPNKRVSSRHIDRLLRNADEYWGRPGLALYFGSQLSAIQFGVVGHVMATSATLGEAIDLFLRYYKLRFRALEISVDIGSNSISVNFNYSDPYFQSNRMHTDIGFAASLRVLGSILDQKNFKTMVEMTFDDGGYRKLYDEIFPDGVKFNAEKNVVHFYGVDIDEKLVFSNKINSMAARQMCEEELKLMAKNNLVSSQVKELIGISREEPPKITQVASNLGYSERNLRRLLADEGYKYRDLVSQVRSEYAARLLKANHLPIADIAQMLGYDDYSNFSRAFKSWFGKSPAEYRRDIDD